MLNIALEKISTKYVNEHELDEDFYLRHFFCFLFEIMGMYTKYESEIHVQANRAVVEFKRARASQQTSETPKVFGL